MLESWADHPAVQGGIAPLAVALVVGTLLWRTRAAWLAIAAGYLVMLTLAGDLAFAPLTAARKVIVVGIVAAAAGIAVDMIARQPRALAATLVVAFAALSFWVFLSLLRQREGAALLGLALGVAVFIGLVVAATLALRDDGVRTGAAGLGLGIATGVAGVLSASIGYLLGGIAVAAASGAMLLIQIVARRSAPAGYAGALTIGVLAAYFAAATFLLAELPWYALPLMLAVPLAARLPLPQGGWLFFRAAAAGAYTLVAASLPIAAAWYAARGSFT